jgi:hypothetical protein
MVAGDVHPYGSIKNDTILKSIAAIIKGRRHHKGLRISKKDILMLCGTISTITSVKTCG